MLFRSLFLVAAFSVSIHAADNWPQFRGPSGDGHSDATGIPLTFGETEHVKWKTPIHGKSWSSPVIWGSQIWMTAASEDGKELSVICVDKETGKILQDKILFHIAEPQFAHKFNSYASPTPVIENGRVYVTFGSPGTACLDTKDGKVLWERRDFVCNHFRGAGSSPIVFENLLIMNFDGSDFQFVVALDKKTGKDVWRTQRSVDFQDLDPDGKPKGEGDYRKAFSTPNVVMHDGKPVLLDSGSKAHYGYDPRTGRELWRVEERDHYSASTRPIAGFGLAYFPTGLPKGHLYAVKLGGSGLLDASQIAWRESRNVPSKPSLLLDGELLYMVDDGGIVSCIEAKTGKGIWRERILGNYSASPLLVEGRIYFFSEHGEVVVLKPGKEFKVLAENKFDDGFMASPAVSGKALFLRSKTHLYRVEN